MCPNGAVAGEVYTQNSWSRFPNIRMSNEDVGMAPRIGEMLARRMRHRTDLGPCFGIILTHYLYTCQ